MQITADSAHLLQQSSAYSAAEASSSHSHQLRLSFKALNDVIFLCAPNERTSVVCAYTESAPACQGDGARRTKRCDKVNAAEKALGDRLPAAVDVWVTMSRIATLAPRTSSVLGRMPTPAIASGQQRQYGTYSLVLLKIFSL